MYRGVSQCFLMTQKKMKGEKNNALPNKNSLRGYEVIINSIKAAEMFPKIVSCADILAFANQTSIILSYLLN